MGEFVTPRPGSRVLEWEAVQVCGADCFPAVRRLLKGSPWVAQLNLTDKGAVVVVSQVTPTGIDQWGIEPGEWIVKSPHGKFHFMGVSEFEANFDLDVVEL